MSTFKVLWQASGDLLWFCFRVIDGNFLDWFWLRPATTAQIVALFFHYDNPLMWMAVFVVLIGEYLLHLAALNWHDYKLWAEGVLAGYLLVYPKATYEKTDFAGLTTRFQLPGFASQITSKIFESVGTTFIGVNSPIPITKMTAYQMAGGRTPVFLPIEFAKDIQEGLDGAGDDIEDNRRKLGKWQKLFDLYHEIGHTSVTHNHFLRQARFSLIYFCALIISLHLQSGGSWVTTLSACGLCVAYYLWLLLAQSQRTRLEEHYELYADFYGLYCLLNTLKAKYGDEDDLAAKKFRAIVVCFVRTWRRIKHHRCKSARPLIKFAKLVVEEPLTGANHLLGFSASLRPPFMVKTFVIIAISFIGKDYFLTSWQQLLGLALFWLALMYLLWNRLHQQALIIKFACWEHLKNSGYSGDLLDIGW